MPRLISVETTPNPNSFKLNLAEPVGLSGTFTRGTAPDSPASLRRILALDGIQSLYAAADFITVNRDPRADWQPLLTAIRTILASDAAPVSTDNLPPDAPAPTAGPDLGEVRVQVQQFRGIPIQVKATDGHGEARHGLPERFGETVRALQAHFGADYLKERQWADWGGRYGTPEDIAREVAEEIDSLMDEKTLAHLKAAALEPPGTNASAPNPADPPPPTGSDLSDPDWRKRFQAVQRLGTSPQALPHLVRALRDEKPPIRRWAAARLGGIHSPEAVAALSGAILNDADIGVRRTAGDSLSDIGDPTAEPAACQALRDPNKLVRWRAARFLAEIGTDRALPALEAARNDPEYEVRLEIDAAIQHIRAGSKPAAPIWQQMTR